jgi:hypothetical protein
MLGYVTAAVEQEPGGYDRLRREADRIGQVLFIGAQVDGTGFSGIGCIFDDPIRELAGPENLALQLLYRFTVGAARP